MSRDQGPQDLPIMRTDDDDLEDLDFVAEVAVLIAVLAITLVAIAFGFWLGQAAISFLSTRFS